MQEWLNWPAWKASKPQKGFGGSNPPLSAKRKRSKEMSILSASFCFCSTTHTNLFVGRSDVKTNLGWFINSLRSADFCKEPAGEARERRVALALRCQSLIRSHDIFALLRFFCGVKRGIRSACCALTTFGERKTESGKRKTASGKTKNKKTDKFFLPEQDSNGGRSREQTEQ